MRILPRDHTNYQLDDHFIPLSGLEGIALQDILSLGCRLYYQRGKERIPGDPQVLLSHLISENRALRAPCPCDSVGVDVGSLPGGVSIIDVDNALLAGSIGEYLENDTGLSIEGTPSGGLHVWGRGLSNDLPKEGLCRAGVRLEYFLRGRLTMLGPGRRILRWTSLARLGNFPPPLLPGGASPEIREPIPYGRRWNSLYEQITCNKGLDKDTLLFQARYLCTPPLETDKENDLLKILERDIALRSSQGVHEGESLEESVSKTLADALTGKWIFRLPEKEWYKYTDGHWSTHEGAGYDFMNDIEDELVKRREKYTAGHRRRMGTLQFRKLMEEHLRQRLYKTPKPQKGVHFTNGLLVVQGTQRELVPSEPGVWSFHQCGIEYTACTQLTDVHKGFLLSLTNGDPLKLNVIRAYLRLLFTHDNSEQFCIYLWGPGATGKSTFVQLLEYILGDAACALDILRLTNRFEMRAVQDKIFITLPDIPLKVNDAQCSMIKRFVSGDKVVIEIKNGSIYGVSITALLLVTSNSRWLAQDRTSGFRRRILYVLTPRAAPQRDPFLLKKLKVGASGLINWALDMPDERARIGQSVEAINELSGGGQDNSGILEWVLTKVKYHPKSELYLGAKKVPLAGSLYESYMQYADAQGIEPVSYYSFGDVLDDTLRAIGYRDIVTKRRAQGRVVVGVSLHEGEPIRRNKRSAVVKYLMEAEPWEGFLADKDAFERSDREDREGKDKDAANIDCVDCVDPVDCVDCVDLFGNLGDNTKAAIVAGLDQQAGKPGAHPGEPRLIDPPKRPIGKESYMSDLLEKKIGDLTGAEEKKTTRFLEEHPRLLRALTTLQGDWTEDQIVEEAGNILQTDSTVKESLDHLYTSLERGGPSSCLNLPPKLDYSTTMAGVVYPLAPAIEESLCRLKGLPTRYEGLITTLNEAATRVVETTYMLFRLFRRQGSTYFNRGCPIKGLFATSYKDTPCYPRLVPQNAGGSGTISCIRRDCKEVIRRLVNKYILPDNLVLCEIDMVACHTGIYAGLTGEVSAPYTWEAYNTGQFWSHIMRKWGEEVPKRVIKTLLYSGLNGASLRGNGTIRAKVQELYGQQEGKSFEQSLLKVLSHPILLELALFQSSLSKREKIYIPSRPQPYYGKVEEELYGKHGGSRYHEGLLSSRILASHEVVLLAYLVDCLYSNALGVPISLENDGLLFITRRHHCDKVLAKLDAYLQACSLQFLGVRIPLERK